MSDAPVPTKQEMFNAAYLGLEAQGFIRAYGERRDGLGGCLYLDNHGRRCAWGHVDKSLTNEIGGVETIKIGIAKRLNEEDLEFAKHLQWVHDTSYSPNSMVSKLRDLANTWNLTIPEAA